MSRILYFSLLTSCLLSAPALAGEALTGRVETNIRAGHERSIFMSEFWVPFMQGDHSVLYGDLRMMGDDQDNREGNLGIGYRQVISLPLLGSGVAGGNAWFDRRITARNSSFHQITLGGEWLGEEFDVRANGYIPLSDKREIEIPNADPQGPVLAGTGILVDTNGTVLEEPQHGFDLELGFELGQHVDFVKDHTDSLRLYGGGYYFNGDYTDDVAGWRTRLAADVTENIQIGARFQRDDERGSQGFLEATIRFPFGSKKSYRKESLRARLDESPERDIDIVTGEQVTDTGDRVPVINKTTGTAQEVLHVDNTAAGGGDGSAETPFNTLAAAQGAASAHTVIYVHTGDATTTNQDQGVALSQTGQQLIGAGTNFVFDSGRFATANGATPTSILIAPATTAPKITNVNAAGDGITITADNVTVAGVTVDGATRDGIVVRADGAAASAQGVSIQDVTAQNNRMGIYIHGANDGAVSAKVQRAVTTSNSQHGIAVYDDTDDSFTADLGGGALGSTGNNVLAGNTLEDLAVELDGGTLYAQNNWWGQASGPDTDDPSVGIAPQIYYGAPINDGLVGHWTFDNEWTTNSTAYDRSGQGNDGTLQGGLSLADQVAGQNRQALDFDGVDDHILPASVLLPKANILADGITISSWVKTTNEGGIVGQSASVSFSTYSTTGLVLQGGGTRIYAYEPADNYYQAITAGVNDDTWHHILGTFSDTDSKLRIYIDGTLQATTTHSFTDMPSANYSVIGAVLKDIAPQYLDGIIDNVSVYRRDFNATEISELYRMDTSSAVNTSGFLTAAP